jgi:DNA-binding winged helix-turn-helix (wHTH) protein
MIVKKMQEGLEKYFSNISREQFIEDLKKAGFKIKSNSKKRKKSKYFQKTIDFIENTPTEELMEKIKEYGVKFVKNPNYKGVDK